MKCKCGNEMVEFTVEYNDFYYCEKCGRFLEIYFPAFWGLGEVHPETKTWYESEATKKYIKEQEK